MAARRVDRLSYRLVAAGALMLLAFLPLLLSGNGNMAHPVSGYKMTHGYMSSPATTER